MQTQFSKFAAWGGLSLGGNEKLFATFEKPPSLPTSSASTLAFSRTTFVEVCLFAKSATIIIAFASGKNYDNESNHDSPSCFFIHQLETVGISVFFISKRDPIVFLCSWSNW